MCPLETLRQPTGVPAEAYCLPLLAKEVLFQLTHPDSVQMQTALAAFEKMDLVFPVQSISFCVHPEHRYPVLIHQTLRHVIEDQNGFTGRYLDSPVHIQNDLGVEYEEMLQAKKSLAGLDKNSQDSRVALEYRRTRRELEGEVGDVLYLIYRYQLSVLPRLRGRLTGEQGAVLSKDVQERWQEALVLAREYDINVMEAVLQKVLRNYIKYATVDWPEQDELVQLEERVPTLVAELRGRVQDVESLGENMTSFDQKELDSLRTRLQIALSSLNRQLINNSLGIIPNLLQRFKILPAELRRKWTRKKWKDIGGDQVFWDFIEEPVPASSLRTILETLEPANFLGPDQSGRRSTGYNELTHGISWAITSRLKQLREDFWKDVRTKLASSVVK